MSRPGYPLWWDTTITIYNKFLDTQTDVITWYRSVVTDCFWKLDGTQVTIGNTVLDSKSTICRIPKDPRFLEKQDWINVPNDQMAQYFTIGRGDIIIKGEITDVINEYVPGHRSSDLLAKYTELQGCLEVSEFTINTGIGRNNEHYFVRGK